MPPDGGGGGKFALTRRTLNGYSLERLRVLVAAALAYVAVPLAHELLEIPLAPRLGDLAFVLLERLDLLVQRRRDVDQVVARGPERNPDLLHLVRLVTLLEERSKRARVARVGVHRRHRRLTHRQVVWVRTAHRRVQHPARDVRDD